MFGRFFGFGKNKEKDKENKEQTEIEKSRAEEEEAKADAGAESEGRAQENEDFVDIETIAQEQAQAEEPSGKAGHSESAFDVWHDTADSEGAEYPDDESGFEEAVSSFEENKEIADSEQTEAEPDEAILPEPEKDLNLDSQPQEEVPASKGFFAKLKEGLTKTRENIEKNIDSVLKTFVKIDDDMYDALEEALIMADIGTETSFFIIEELKKKVKFDEINDAKRLKQAIRDIISDIMQYEDNALKLGTKPSVIVVIGVNGVGKTTSIGKIANKLKSEGKSVMLAAGDSFRAGAIDQLEIWAQRVGVPIIKHKEGADPGAVIFDAISSAKAKETDVVICDTAGRLHNKKNLMDELSKIFKIINRELPEADIETLLVLDATTGQNAVVQAKTFGEVTNISGIVLTKLDGTAKGGIVIAITKEQKIPVKLVGVGEGIDDLQEFDPKDFANALLPETE